MNKSTRDLPEVRCLVGGDWRSVEAGSYTPVYNPSTGEVIARTPMCDASAVGAAVAVAAKAFESWSLTPVTNRAGVFFRYRNLLEQHFEELARLVTLENGKTAEEAKGDVRRGIEVVDSATAAPYILKGESLPQVASFIDAQVSREPIGVCVGITPFNFPAMVPMWMFPLAIACGNTFVLKPSEKVPLTAVRLGELLMEAGLPPGVFNLVHGGREAVDALCTHPGVASVSFVGSSPVARHVYSLACSHGKRVQAAGGAKNVLLVMPDADQESTLRAIIGASFGCAGQRCMAGSLLIAVGRENADRWRDRLAGAADRLKVDNTVSNPAADMGPLIDGAAQQRVLGLIAQAEREGATLVRDGRGFKTGSGFFVGPTLLDNVSTEMSAFGTEIFGPVLSSVRANTLDKAVAIMQHLDYGNGATIFTNSGGAAREFVRRMPAGMIGVNVGVPAPMAPFPFTGWNGSFYGDLHMQGAEGIAFYTRSKVVLSRWDSQYVRAQGW